MADKARFTPEEWSALRDAPHLLSMAVASAGASGLLGTLKEAFSSSASLVEAMKSDAPLLRAISAKEELQAAQQELRATLGEVKSAGDFAAVRDRIAALALERARDAQQILARKGDPGEAQAYAEYLKSLAKRVADAAKEGGFLGFGGERVSAGERDLLAKLDGALARKV
jgi:hypothetical protein